MNILRNFATLAAVALSVPAILAADLSLKFDRPAQFFEETFVIGNGRLGGIIYGGTETDRVALNDITLWTGEPIAPAEREDCRPVIAEIRRALDEGQFAVADSLQRRLQGNFSQNYQPLGDLIIRYNNPPTGEYSRRLDLTTARAKVNSGTRTTEYFASAPDSVIAIRITDPAGIDATFKLTCQLPSETIARGNEIATSGYAAYHSLPSYRRAENPFSYDADRGIHFETILKVVAPGAIITTAGDSLTVSGTNEVVLLVGNATSFNGFDKNPVKDGKPFKTIVRRQIADASETGYDKLRDRAEKAYSELFNRVALDLGTTDNELAALTTDRQLLSYTDNHDYNPDLEELYFQYGRYLLISSSQTPGVPANLQGLWNERMLPPWSCNYTTNINLQENYWGAETTALPEMHTVLLEFIMNLTKNGADAARQYCGVTQGWSLGHNTDIWAMANPVGLGDSSPSWANWVMGSTWLATHIWEHYMFGRDKEVLRRYYPALKGASEFAMDWLYEHDGELITSPSTSPENLFVAPDGKAWSTWHGSTADMAMIRECLADTRQAALALGEDEALVARIDSVLPRLRPYRTNPDGSLAEWYGPVADKEPQHRHQSHLVGLYPGHHLSPSLTPELAEACARTLEIKGTETTGWSAGWRVNLHARLANAEKAYSMYRRLLQYVSPDGYRGPDRRKGGGTYPNLLDAHSPFQIDGNFGGSAGVAEMLLQSTPETITLLPATPEQWRTGKVTGLRTRTGHKIAFDWNDGKVTNVTLSAGRPEEAAQTVTLNVNGTTRKINAANKPKISIKL